MQQRDCTQETAFHGYTILCHCIIVSLCHCIVSYRIIVSLYRIVSYHCIIVSLYHYIIVSLYHIVSYHVTQELNLPVKLRFYANNIKRSYTLHQSFDSLLSHHFPATDRYTTWADGIHRGNGDVRLNSSCPYYRVGSKVGGVCITPMVKYENLVHVNSQWEMGEDLWGANLVATESNRCAGIPV